MIDHSEFLDLLSACEEDPNLIPDLEWLKENVSTGEAVSIWLKDAVKYKVYIDAFKTSGRPDDWQNYIAPENVRIVNTIPDVEHQNLIPIQEQAKNWTFIPSLEWCKENVSLYQAANLWTAYGSEHFKSELECFRNTKPKTWQFFVDPIELKKQKESEILTKNKKQTEKRQKAALVNQSTFIRDKLAKPISFKHSSGIYVTVFNCISVTQVAIELNKISFVQRTNLCNLLNGSAQSTKGWSLYH